MDIKPIVYVDVLFLVNFLANLFLLILTGKLTKLEYRIRRIAVAAFLAALYAVLIFIPDLEMLSGFIFKITSGAFMVFVAFGKFPPKRFVAILSVFWTASAVFAGICIALFFFAGQSLNALISNGIIYFNIPVYILIFSAGVSYLAMRSCNALLKKRNITVSQSIRLCLTLGDKNTYLTAFEDTGNRLSDPVSGLPVMLCEYDSIKNLLPDEIKNLYETTELTLTDISHTNFTMPIRIIPYRALGVNSGFILGFKPDRIAFEMGGDRKTYLNAIIGIGKGCFPPDKDYTALFNPMLI